MTAKTTAERQAAYRARKLAANLTEVRGIFALRKIHPAIKSAAKKTINLEMVSSWVRGKIDKAREVKS